MAQAPATQPAPTQKRALRGSVLDAGRQPIAGAVILLLPSVRFEGKRPPSVPLQSDAAGRFAGELEVPKPAQTPADLDGPPKPAPDDWKVPVLIFAPGFALQSAELGEADNAITLQRGAPATGLVKDAQGQPVAGARVRAQYLQLPDGGDGIVRLRGFVNFEDWRAINPLQAGFETLTDEKGAWTLRDLPVGSTVSVNLADPRFVNQSVQATIGATPDETPLAAPDIVAKPGASLSGRVLFPDGRPVEGANIIAKVEAAERGYAQTYTAADGTFSVSGLPAGKGKIEVTPPSEAIAPSGVQNLQLSVELPLRAPDITLSTGIALSGIVSDAETQLPLAGARVIAIGPFGNAFSTPSDAQGRYIVRAVAGSNRFYVYDQPRDYLRDYMNGDITKTIAAPTDTAATTPLAAAPNFALRRGVTLRGTALDEAGLPVSDATIAAGGLFDGAVTKTDARGAWTLRGVDPRGSRGRNPGAANAVTLQCSGDWEITSGANVSLPSADPVALKLRRVVREDVTVRVLTPAGEPVAGAQVRMAILIDAARGATRVQNRATNARGEVVLRGLRPEESAEITPSKAGYSLGKAGVVTAANAQNGAARAQNAVLTPLDNAVRGRVIDAAGAPVAGALVAALFPGDLRDAAPNVVSDAQGRFRLEKLGEGEIIVGAARGREWGQSAIVAGGEAEIRLKSASPQPQGRDVERVFALMAQWMDDDGPKPGQQLLRLAASLAKFDRPRAEKLLAQFGGKGNEKLPQETIFELVERDPAQNAGLGRAQIAGITDAKQRRAVLLDLGALIARVDAPAAQEIYDSIAVTTVIPPAQGPHKDDIFEAYAYARLAGLAGALGDPDAPKWRAALTATVKRLSADEQMFRFGGYAKTVAQGDPDGAMNWARTFSPALQVRALEDVIPVVAERDLAAARRLLSEMETLVARPDMPVEADRNDAMYRPTPTHSLDVARVSIIKKVAVSDPETAYELARKLGNDGYGLKELEAETAAHLPRETAIPALREAFDAAGRNGYGEAGSRARIASLMAPFDAAQSEEFFRVAREKLVSRGGFEGEDAYREAAAAFAFYRAPNDPAAARLLLENEWQRTLKARAALKKPSGRFDSMASVNANRLDNLAWAMAPLDFERALEMLNESRAFPTREWSDIDVRHHLVVYLLSSEAERPQLSFERPRRGELE